MRELQDQLAGHQLAKGTFIKTVQDMVGHTSPATTSHYVGALKEDSIRAVQENAL